MANTMIQLTMYTTGEKIYVSPSDIRTITRDAGFTQLSLHSRRAWFAVRESPEAIILIARRCNVSASWWRRWLPVIVMVPVPVQQERQRAAANDF